MEKAVFDKPCQNLRAKTPFSFNPVSLLLVIAIMPIPLIAGGGLKYNMIFFVLSGAILLLHGKWKSLVKFAAVFLFFFYFGDFLVKLGNAALITYFFSLSFVGIRLIPALMLATIIVREIKTSELISSLSFLPDRIKLAFTVAMRFLPVYAKEHKIILDSLKMRGIALSIKHPIKALEYVLVPVLFRATAIADEMTATAINKGIENPAKRSDIYNVKWRAIDSALLAITIVISIFCLLGY